MTGYGRSGGVFMIIGVPREVRPSEYRVGLTPAGTDALLRRGHTVYVERGAGAGGGFADKEYQAVGAQVACFPEVVVRVGRPPAAEHEYFQGQTLVSFLHLAVASPDLRAALQQGEMTVITCETIQADDGSFPVLHPTSEVAGRLAPIIAGSLLETMLPHGADE